ELRVNGREGEEVNVGAHLQARVNVLERDAADEPALKVQLRIGVLTEDAADAVHKLGAKHPFLTARYVLVVGDYRGHLLCRLGYRCVGERQFAGGEELVVLVRPCRAHVDVLEPVGQRPGVTPADGPWGLAGRDVLIADRDHLVPGRRDLDAHSLERIGVIPDGALGIGFHSDAVELAVHGTQVLPGLAVARADVGCRQPQSGQRLERSLAGQVSHHAWAWYDGDHR